MNESTRSLIILILVALLLLAVAFLGTSFMSKRAIKSVIKSFRDNQALSPETARLPEEIGLGMKGAFQFRSLRDYRPSAIGFLQQQEILLNTGEGKIYLSEEKLTQSGIEKRL